MWKSHPPIINHYLSNLWKNTVRMTQNMNEFPIKNSDLWENDFKQEALVNWLLGGVLYWPWCNRRCPIAVVLFTHHGIIDTLHGRLYFPMNRSGITKCYILHLNIRGRGYFKLFVNNIIIVLIELPILFISIFCLIMSYLLGIWQHSILKFPSAIVWDFLAALYHVYCIYTCKKTSGKCRINLK